MRFEAVKARKIERREIFFRREKAECWCCWQGLLLRMEEEIKDKKADEAVDE